MSESLLAGSIILDAANSIPLTVNGRILHCRPPKRLEALRWLRFLQQADAGDAEAKLYIYESFPAFVGVPEEAFEDVTPGEMLLLVTRFFSRMRRQFVAAHLGEAAAKAMEQLTAAVERPPVTVVGQTAEPMGSTESRSPGSPSPSMT